VERYHGAEAARAAEEHFTRVVREGRAPDEMPTFVLPDGGILHVPTVLAECFGLSTSEARRLIAQGAVKVDGELLHELDAPRERLVGAVLQAGKRRFIRLRA
jgi:tyrosyl-tRNA synthetase